MTALGLLLLILGATLVVVEAHVPHGVSGVIGGLALAAGGMVAIVGAGGSLALAVPVGAVIGIGVASWMLVVVSKTSAARRGRILAGREVMLGRMGVVRGWDESSGQVFVDGALWKARRDWPEPEEHVLHEGDRVVVESVEGLTLSVRPAEEWELVA
jgi:membrane-bound serine protease (ClpP class)